MALAGSVPISGSCRMRLRDYSNARDVASKRVLKHGALRGRTGFVPAAARRDAWELGRHIVDHYATLQVPRGAPDAVVKDAYRRLQKRHHPDNSQGDATRSAAINEAYRVLTERGARAKYDAELRRHGPPPASVRDVQGLVGPLLSSGVLVVEALPECTAAACDVDAREDMVQFVRQWGATLTWSAELPLPLPLQFDEVPDGCRLGFVTMRDGAVTLVGELRFTVVLAAEAATDAGTADAAPYVVAVRRQGSGRPLPGEERILRSFRAVCRRHRTPEDAQPKGFQLGGLFAAVAAGAIGGIPFMGGEDRRTYERYHLKRVPLAAPAPPGARSQ